MSVPASSPDHPLYADRCAIADATRQLVAQMPPWPYADVRNPEWCRRVHPRCLSVAQRYAPIKGSVSLLGQSGAGKTSALRAALWRLRLDALRAADVGHPIVNAWWCSAVDVARRRRELKLGVPNHDLERMTKATLLVIDEIGQEDAPPQWLLEVLDERYRHRRPTLTTSGLTRSQLEGRYGAGIVRRLEEPSGQIVDLYEGAGG